MKYNYFLGLIIAVCIYTSYANLQSYNANFDRTEFAASINDFVNKAQNGGQVNNSSPADSVKNSLSPVKNDSQEQTQILDDNSKIQTMYDGFGNKTETRCFNNHPRLTCIVSSSAADGERQVTVYGQNGNIKKLPENMIDQAMTASGDEIANSAGIYAARQQEIQPGSAQTTPAPILPVPLKPTADSQSSNKNFPNAQLETESVVNAEPTTSDSKAKPSPTVGKIKPEEKK